MAKYAYPAVFSPENNGGFSVSFPDLEECYTSGDDLKDALFMAEDVLTFALYNLERGGKPIPEASHSENIELKSGEFMNYIACDTVTYAKRYNNKAIKKTLSIPEWLNEAAMNANINFSHVLQEALMNKLDIK